ncbi:MAG: hypothetical protein U1C74_25575 [Phenylobacterium sp.]|nr:hypothetical protein [Phenylobacterium sp.]
MDFKFATLDSAIEADWPVTINVPQDGGKVSAQKLMVRFRLVDEEELTKNGDGLEGSKATLRQVVVGFGKSVTEPWSAELFEKMLAQPYVRLGLNNAYRDFAVGIAAKN